MECTACSIHRGDIKGRWRTRTRIFFLRRMLECGWCLACWENAKGNCTDRVADENAYECDHRKRTVGIQGISLLCKEILAFSSCKLPLRIGSFHRYNNLLSCLLSFHTVTSVKFVSYDHAIPYTTLLSKLIGQNKRTIWQDKFVAKLVEPQRRLFLYVIRGALLIRKFYIEIIREKYMYNIYFFYQSRSLSNFRTDQLRFNKRLSGRIGRINIQVEKDFIYLFGNMSPYKRICLYKEGTGIILLRSSRSSWSAMTRLIGFSTIFVTRTLLIPIPRCDIWFRLLLAHWWNRLKWYVWLGGILNLLHPLYHFVGNATPTGITWKIHRRCNC